MSHDVTAKPAARAIFNAALPLTDPAERRREIDRLCGGDEGLREKVEQLLAAHARAGESPIDRIVLDFGPEETVLSAAAVTTKLDLATRPQIGPYKLLEQIGEGGMGVVYVAEQTEPIRRRVALKIIKPGMDSRQVVARFEAERQALALMDHRNIATVLDAGVSEAGLPYFVMELVRGLPITEYCDAAKLTPDQRIELFIAVCQAVQHAHQKGIIHRDLKPSNVMVTLHDGKPVSKVIDFGVAKAIGTQLSDNTVYTAFTQLVGTPLYMSPEQAELSGLDIDTRSDVYSLGVLLYELLTGRTPFDSETLFSKGLDEMRRIIREQEPPRPSHRLSTLKAADVSTVSSRRSLDERRLQQELTGELDWIVMKALEKDRDRRYESASALAADLRRYLSDEPVLACPPSMMYRLRKTVRRHKGVLASTVLVATALLVGTGVSVWQAMVAEERRKDVEDKNEQLQATNQLLDDKNQELEEKNQIIAAAESVATSNFGLAKRAVADLVARVGRDDLAAFPQLAELRTGLLTSARDFYTDLIETNPGDHKLYVERAKLWSLLNNDQAALDDYHQALKLVPDDGDLLIRIGSLHNNLNDYRLQDTKLAAEYLRKGQELNPQNPDSWSELARFGDYAGDPLKKAYELETDPAMKQLRLARWQAYVQKDADAAFAAFDQAASLATDRHVKVSIQFDRAWFLNHLSRHDEAIAVLTQLIREDSFNHHHYSLRGSVYENLGQREQAIADWERAVELSQQCWWLRKRLALWYFEHGRRAEVIPQLSTAVELNPADTSTLTWIPPDRIAGCGDPEIIKAYRQLADRFVELNARSPESLSVRAEVCIALEDDKQAVADLDAALEGADAGFQVYYRAALLALDRQDQTSYRDHCRRMLKKFGQSTIPEDNSFTAWTCALAPQALEDYAPAVQLAEQSVAAAMPAERWRLGALGGVLLRSGNAERALQVLKEAGERPATEKTSAAYAVYFQALALQQLGRPADAGAARACANALAAEELDDTTSPPSWNRRLTLELLRNEAEGAITLPDHQPPPD